MGAQADVLATSLGPDAEAFLHAGDRGGKVGSRVDKMVNKMVNQHDSVIPPHAPSGTHEGHLCQEA